MNVTAVRDRAERNANQYKPNTVKGAYWRGQLDALNQLLDHDATADQLDQHLREYLGARISSQMHNPPPRNHRYPIHLGRVTAYTDMVGQLNHHHQLRNEPE